MNYKDHSQSSKRSGFIISEGSEESFMKKKLRSEEWARVRQKTSLSKEEDHLHQPRPLYEQLQEQKLKEEEEFEETWKLGNLIRKVNEDEYEYLLELERELYEKEKEAWLLDQEEVQRFKSQVKQFEEQQQEEAEISLNRNINYDGALPNKEIPIIVPTKNLQKTILCSTKIKVKPKLPTHHEVTNKIPLSSKEPLCCSLNPSSKLSIIDYEESDKED